jgi:hypothetical protein
MQVLCLLHIPLQHFSYELPPTAFGGLVRPVRLFLGCEDAKSVHEIRFIISRKVLVLVYKTFIALPCLALLLSFSECYLTFCITPFFESSSYG